MNPEARGAIYRIGIGFYGLVIAVIMLIQFEEGTIIRTVGGPHLLSQAAFFVFGVFVIVPPYFDSVQTYKQLFIRSVMGLMLLAFAYGILEGSWDMMFVLTNPGYISAVMGAAIYSGAAIVVNLVTRTYEMFNWKRLGVTLAVVWTYLLVWVAFGFPISGYPQYVTSIPVALTEIGHWVIGLTLLGWSLQKRKMVMPTKKEALLALAALASFVFCYHLLSGRLLWV